MLRYRSLNGSSTSSTDRCTPVPQPQSGRRSAHRPADIRPRLPRCDSSDPSDIDESADATEANEPIDNNDANEPALPIDRIEPALPTDRIEFFDPIDRIEFFDPTDRIEFSDPTHHLLVASVPDAVGSTRRRYREAAGS